MDGKRVTIVAVVAILVGLLVGYLFWGYPAKRVEGELTQARARLEEAQKAAAAQAEALNTKVKDLETQLDDVTKKLEAERSARTALEARISKGRK